MVLQSQYTFACLMGSGCTSAFMKIFTMRVNKSMNKSYSRSYMNIYCLLDKLKGCALRYFNLSQDAKYFPLKHVGKATLKLLLLKSTITHRIFLSFLKIARLVSYADKCYSNVYNIHISYYIHRIYVMTMNLIT